MAFMTVEDGQEGLLFTNRGQGRLVIGPRRLFVWSDQRLEILERYTANQNQYMIIKDREGAISHVPGPFEKFLNPLEVESISVRSAIKLDANHSLVVYKQNEEHIERRIVSGPIVFVPGPQEWELLRT